MSIFKYADEIISPFGALQRLLHVCASVKLVLVYMSKICLHLNRL